MAHGFDMIVIGAGWIGSAAAYHLAQIDPQELLLAPFYPGQQPESSHASSRTIRYAQKCP